jgi:8-oxo-dGTP pyrophosphatase MutT (NUDIX family)
MPLIVSEHQLLCCDVSRFGLVVNLQVHASSRSACYAAWMSSAFDTRVGAYCVVIEDGRVLLAHLNEALFGPQGGWTLPGGGMDPFESPEQCAIRELHEETGLAVELDGLLTVDSFTVLPENRLHEADRKRALLSLRIIYCARQAGGELRAEADGTTDGAAWFTLDEVSSLVRVELVDVALQALSARASAGHLSLERS